MSETFIMLRPHVVKALGGAKLLDAAIVCRAATLSLHVGDADGWFAKSVSAWVEETGCARSSVNRALRWLVAEGYMEQRSGGGGASSSWRLTRAGAALTRPGAGPVREPDPSGSRTGGSPGAGPVREPDGYRTNGTGTESPATRPGAGPVREPDTHIDLSVREIRESAREADASASPPGPTGPLDALPASQRQAAKAWCESPMRAGPAGRHLFVPPALDASRLERQFGDTLSAMLSGPDARVATQTLTDIAQQGNAWTGWYTPDGSPKSFKAIRAKLRIDVDNAREAERRQAQRAANGPDTSVVDMHLEGPWTS